VDGAPKPVKEAIPKKDAEEIKKQLEDAGGKAEIKYSKSQVASRRLRSPAFLPL
jgi:hypothetical protein